MLPRTWRIGDPWNRADSKNRPDSFPPITVRVDCPQPVGRLGVAGGYGRITNARGEQSLGWTAVTWRIVRGLAWGVVATCVIGVVLFVAGGTLDRSAWQVYCAVYGLLGFFFGLTADPGLIKERKRPGPGASTVGLYRSSNWSRGRFRSWRRWTLDGSTGRTLWLRHCRPRA